jgi:hypothetical protein
LHVRALSSDRPLGRLSKQKTPKVYSCPPFGASERTKTLQNVLLSALGGICANKKRPKTYSCRPLGASERTIMAPNVLWAALGAPHTTLNQPFSPIIALSDVPFPTHFRPNRLLWDFSRKCVMLSIPEPAFPGPSRADSSFRPATHFRQNGLLWHISRKCVAGAGRRVEKWKIRPGIDWICGRVWLSL